MGDFSSWFLDFDKKREACGVSKKELCVLAGISSGKYCNWLFCGQNARGDALERKALKSDLEAALSCLDRGRKVYLQVDYFRVSFPVVSEVFDLDNFCNSFLGVPFSCFIHQGRGWHGYESYFKAGHVGLAFSRDFKNGLLLEMSGMACREFELYLLDREMSWEEFWEKCLFQGGRIKRLDIAINDVLGLLSIPRIRLKLLNGEVKTLFGKWEYVGGGIVGKYEKEGMGDTVYIGKKGGDIYFCLYQKDYEQFYKLGKDLDTAPVKNRFELRFHDVRAAVVVKELIQAWHDGRMMSEIIFGIVERYLEFYDKPKSFYKRGQERKEWGLWRKFIGGPYEEVRLALKPEPYNREGTLRWLKKDVMRKLKANAEYDEKYGFTDIRDMWNEAKVDEKYSRFLEIEAGLNKGLKSKLTADGFFYC